MNKPDETRTSDNRGERSTPRAGHGRGCRWSDAYRLDPGHDVWAVGDYPFVAPEFESKTAETYADG
jgi:hypothetical protein